MADAGLFIGWGKVVRGREAQAVESFNATVDFLGRRQGDGRIEGFEICFLDRHGGDLDGFMLVRGSVDQMNALHDDEEFMRLVMRADLLIESLGVVRAYLNEAIAQQMAMFQEEIAALA